MLIDSPYLIKPGSHVDLSKLDTAGGHNHDKDDCAKKSAKHLDRIAEQQEKLFAEAKQSLLVVLQGMDTSGKDGTIRHVFRGVNAQGCKITSFKAPSSFELSHDYLWRVHAAVPPRGMIGIFNRSHYEDVLVPAVMKYATPHEIKRRYDHINAFEKMLVDEGTTVIKILLHISKTEQAERLQSRLDRPEKNWKFNPADIDSRKQWGAYQKEYDRLLFTCSTDLAPWYVVPSDKKWYRNYIISGLIADVLEGMRPKFPKVNFDPKSFVIE